MDSDTQTFPAMRYRPDTSEAGFESAVVNSPEDEAELGPGWANTPAAFGVETAPGAKPDLEIASHRPVVEPAEAKKPKK